MLFSSIQRRTALACLLCVLAVPAVWADSDKRIVKVMTQNMDAGTDLLYVAGGGLAGVAPTYLEIRAKAQGGDFSARADRLAAEIEVQQPYLISLQEVSRWIAQSTADPSQNLSVDQLDLLVAALAAHQQHYDVVAVNKLSDITLPVDLPNPTLFLQFTDRDVILARSDLKQSELDISNIQINRYQTILEFPVTATISVPILRGWISADVKIRGKKFRCVNTHLESFVAAIQGAQAAELVQVLNATTLPVVLAGDFNSNADQTATPLYPDDTPTYALIVNAGYTDAWSSLHPGDPGFTWALFFEDPPAPASPFERIDLILERNMTILDIQRVADYPYASDHAGVVATLRIEVN